MDLSKNLCWSVINTGSIMIYLATNSTDCEWKCKGEEERPELGCDCDWKYVVEQRLNSLLQRTAVSAAAVVSERGIFPAVNSKIFQNTTSCQSSLHKTKSYHQSQVVVKPVWCCDLFQNLFYTRHSAREEQKIVAPRHQWYKIVSLDSSLVSCEWGKVEKISTKCEDVDEINLTNQRRVSAS